MRALLDVLGPDGTLSRTPRGQEHVYHAEDWPPAHRRAYRRGPAGVRPGDRRGGPRVRRIPERVRTWPGALRSSHPEASVAAIGARAAWITGEHPDDDGYGPRSPFARLVEADGQVLMLGAPLDTITFLHHAEAVARVPGKRTVTYRVTLAGDGGLRERTYTDIDTSLGAFPYDSARPRGGRVRRHRAVRRSTPASGRVERSATASRTSSPPPR